MRSEIKIYYTHHFGSFDPLSLKDIQDLCNYEEGLSRLPELEYKKTKKLLLLRHTMINTLKCRQGCK